MLRSSSTVAKGAVIPDCRCGRGSLGVSARNGRGDEADNERLKMRNQRLPGGLEAAGTGAVGETVHQLCVCGPVLVVLDSSALMMTADRATWGCWRHVRNAIVPPRPAPTRWADVASSACMIALTSVTY